MRLALTVGNDQHHLLVDRLPSKFFRDNHGSVARALPIFSVKKI
jgi:hypothetical protein